MLKPVGVTIISKQYSYSEEMYDLFFANGDEPDRTEDDEALLAALERPVTSKLDPEFLRQETENPEDVIEVFTEGRLHVADGHVRLTYTEHDEETGEIKTVISFPESAPGNVIMTRGGAINTTFIFEVGKRTKCVYNLAFAAMELTILTLRVDNRLITDGSLTLDYCIEIRGASVEHRSVTVTLSERSHLSVPKE